MTFVRCQGSLPWRFHSPGHGWRISTRDQEGHSPAYSPLNGFARWILTNAVSVDIQYFLCANAPGLNKNRSLLPNGLVQTIRGRRRPKSSFWIDWFIFTNITQYISSRPPPPPATTATKKKALLLQQKNRAHRIRFNRSPSTISSAPWRRWPRWTTQWPTLCWYCRLALRWSVAPWSPQNCSPAPLKSLPKHILKVTSLSSVCMSKPKSSPTLYRTTKVWCLSKWDPTPG